MKKSNQLAFSPFDEKVEDVSLKKNEVKTKGEGEEISPLSLNLPLESHLKPISQKVTYTKKESFQKLIEIQELALSMEPKPDFTAALRSEELKGKLFGLYQDKKDPPESKEQLKLQTALVEWV